MSDRWKFGHDQTQFEEEEQEIEAAKHAGLIWQYLDGQRWSHMIETEGERRRAARARVKAAA